MKKYGIGWIIVDCLFAIGALINILVDEGSTHDYVVLYFTISIFIALLIRRVCNAKRIRSELAVTREKEQLRHAKNDPDA